MAPSTHDIHVIGAGLAGCEASWRLAQAGLRVRLSEQKPLHRTPAQVSDAFAELVCSNSFRSSNPANAVGLLKEEMAALGSLTLAVAQRHRVPAGDAFAVDRQRFAEALSAQVRAHPRIEVIAERVDALPPPEAGPVILATGPLTADALAASLAQATSSEGLYFYDALAPIVAAEGVDRDVVFAASRWDKGPPDDYLNCPLNQAQYDALIDFLLTADTYPSRAFEAPKYFSGCQPIEAIAASGRQALRFGPLKPVGLTDPKTGRWPYAVVQLRKEDRAAQAYNLVGMQTKLRHGPQKELLGHIPGLQNASILRFGALHRNTYVDGPRHLDAHMRLLAAPHIRLAGQITGVEGYVESAAMGMAVAMLVLHERAFGPAAPPLFAAPSFAIAGLVHHVRGTLRAPKRPYEPQNVHWALMQSEPPIAGARDKAARKAWRLAQAQKAFAAWRSQWAVADATACDRAMPGATTAA